MRLITVIALLLGITLIAGAIDSANALFTLTLAAQPGGKTTVMELATNAGNITTGYLGSEKIDVTGITLKDTKIAGTVKVGEVVYTLDATIDDATVSGKYADKNKVEVNGLVIGTLRSKDALMGSRDFYPTPARPIRYWGDGSGTFPGATPVTSWSEGEIIPAARKIPAKFETKVKNIAWKAQLPGWSNSSPLVVGDRVFITCDPNYLVCVDANTGDIRWQVEVNPFELQGLPAKEAADKAELLKMARAYSALYMFAKRGTADAPETQFAVKTMKNWEPIVEKLDATLLPILRTAIEEIAKSASAARLFDDAVSAKYKIATHFLWENYTGFTYPTPVSDGHYVYVTMGQGQAACYTLEGKLVWGRWFPCGVSDLNTTHCPSPLLANGVLITVHNNMARGLKAATGETIWEQKLPVRPQGPGTYAVVHLTDGDKAVDVVVTTYGFFLDAATGKVLANMKFSMAWEAGSMSIVGEDDTVYLQPRTSGGMGGIDDVAAVTISWKGGVLTLSEPKFIVGLDAAGRTPLFYHGRVYDAGVTMHGYGIGYGNTLRVWDVGQAKEVAKSEVVPKPCDFGWCNGIIAGDLAIFQTGHAYRGDPINRGPRPFSVFRIDGDKAPVLVSAPNLLNPATGIPQVNWFNTYIPEWVEKGKEHFGHYDSKPGIPDIFSFASPTASGNRIFLRSMSHL
ncbi:MAG: PQQ-binding-like beta-propeller repeat protein, partial [bacterium]